MIFCEFSLLGVHISRNERNFFNTVSVPITYNVVVLFCLKCRCVLVYLIYIFLSFYLIYQMLFIYYCIFSVLLSWNYLQNITWFCTFIHKKFNIYLHPPNPTPDCSRGLHVLI